MKNQLPLIFLLVFSSFLSYAQLPALVNDINPNNDNSSDNTNGATGGSTPHDFFEYQDELFYLANAESTISYDLFKGVGDDIINISETLGGFPESISEATVFNDSIFLSSAGKLYRTKGQVLLGSNSIDEVDLGDVSVVNNLTVFQNKLYFAGYTATKGTELYSYANGVVTLIADLAGDDLSFNPDHLIVVNNTLLFRREEEARWWRYTGSGTPAGLANAVYDEIRDYRVYNNKLYFTAKTDITLGTFTSSQHVLMETNGSASAPVVVSGTNIIFDVNNLGIFNDQLVFDGLLQQFNGISIQILGFYDGSNYTYTEKNGFSVGNFFTENNDTLYFSTGNADRDYDNELWRYVEGSLPEEVANINPTGFSSPQELYVFENNLFFSANDGEVGRELWAIGPDYEGTVDTTDLTGIWPLNNINSLNIYPNPATSIINTETGQLNIFDALGNQVLSTESTGTVDVSNLESGVYFVSQNEKRVKLIIE